MNKGFETGPPAYRPYLRRLESLTINFADVITKAALSPQLFKDPVYWSCRDWNLRPPAWKSSTLSIEPTGRLKLPNVLLTLQSRTPRSTMHI